MVTLSDKPYLRYMKPLYAKENCLKCHGFQGYKTGDIRGGVSVAVPMDGYLVIERKIIIRYCIEKTIFLVLGLTSILLVAKSLKRKHHQKKRAQAALIRINRNLESIVEARTAGLKEALSNLKQLSGLLPICSACKRVRDDKGYWNQIESYISSRSEAEFTHSLCPDCEEELFLESFKKETI